MEQLRRDLTRVIREPNYDMNGYGVLVYQKGAWVVHMLRIMMLDLKTMDEGRFTEAMREFYGTYQGKTWRGSDGRIYCKKPSGTTGLLVGGAAGALAGRAIDTRGDRTTGTILGAAVGALLGRHVERKVISKCR